MRESAGEVAALCPNERKPPRIPHARVVSPITTPEHELFDPRAATARSQWAGGSISASRTGIRRGSDRVVEGVDISSKMAADYRIGGASGWAWLLLCLQAAQAFYIPGMLDRLTDSVGRETDTETQAGPSSHIPTAT